MSANDERQAVPAPGLEEAHAWPLVERRRRELPHTGWLHIVDASGNRPARNVGTGHGRGVVTAGAGDVWVANAWSRTVAHLHPRSFEMTSLLRLRKIPVAITAGEDAIWVVCGNGWLWRIWPAGTQAEGVARVGRRARALEATGPVDLGIAATSQPLAIRSG